MTLIGLVAVVAVVGVWVFRRTWTQYVVGAAAVFPQTAGLIVGGNGFPVFYLAVTVLIALSVPYLLLALARPEAVPALTRRRRFVPEIAGVALVLWAAVISYAGPRIFAGMPVFDPALGIDVQVGNLSQLQPSLGNLAQVGYLGIAVALLILGGRFFPVDHRMLGFALWLAIGLALVRLVGEGVWPHELLQNMPGSSYATAERLSGTFYEPSVLGLHLTAAAAYFAARLLTGDRRARVGAVVALGIVGIEFAANGSGTALVGLAVVVAAGAAWMFVQTLRRPRLGVRPWLVVAALAAVAAALTQAPLLAEVTLGAVDAKADSASFVARNAANLRSWQIFVETSGLGVGLGGNRPSSLFFFVLSCLGVIGVVVLGVLVACALRSAARQPVALGAPAGWGLVGVLVAAVVAVPDLSTPVLWVGIAACVLPALSPRVPPARVALDATARSALPLTAVSAPGGTGG